MSQSVGAKRKVARAAGVVMFAIFLSRVLGLVRERAIAEVFGRTSSTDVFYAAFGLPDLMYQLLIGGAISSAFIPVFTEYLASDREDEAWHVASSFINMTAVLLVILTVVGVVFSPKLAPLVGLGFEGADRELLVRLMRITFPAVFFTALSGLAMGVLNSYQKFTASAFAPMLYNTSQILSAYILGPILGIIGMGYGTVVGAIGSFSLQFPSVFKVAKSYYRPRIDLKHPGIKKMFRLMLPALFGLSISQINMIIGQNIASFLEPGSIVALRLSNRLIYFPLGVFAMGLSTAIFPTLTSQVARKEMADFKQTFSFGLRLVFFVTIPSAIGMAVLREPIVRLLFESGQFTAQDTHATAYTLLFYIGGLIGQAGLQILTRVFYSLQDTVTPVKIGLVNVFINTLLCLGFVSWTNLGAAGLALAYSITSIMQMFMSVMVLRKRLNGIDGRRIFNTMVRATIASVIMGVAVYFVAGYLGNMLDLHTSWGKLLQTFGAIAAGVVVYFPASYFLKMDEPIFIKEMIFDRFTSRKKPSKL